MARKGLFLCYLIQFSQKPQKAVAIIFPHTGGNVFLRFFPQGMRLCEFGLASGGQFHDLFARVVGMRAGFHKPGFLQLFDIPRYRGLIHAQKSAYIGNKRIREFVHATQHTILRAADAKWAEVLVVQLRELAVSPAYVQAGAGYLLVERINVLFIHAYTCMEKTSSRQAPVWPQKTNRTVTFSGWF